jgi:hypothetical protein
MGLHKSKNYPGFVVGPLEHELVDNHEIYPGNETYVEMTESLVEFRKARKSDTYYKSRYIPVKVGKVYGVLQFVNTVSGKKRDRAVSAASINMEFEKLTIEERQIIFRTKDDEESFDKIEQVILTIKARLPDILLASCEGKKLVDVIEFTPEFKEILDGFNIEKIGKLAAKNEDGEDVSLIGLQWY